MGIRHPRRNEYCVLVGTRRGLSSSELSGVQYWRASKNDACRLVQAQCVRPLRHRRQCAEWMEECWNDNYRGAPHDGMAWMRGQCRLHVLRGGAFDSQAKYLRSTSRFRYDLDVRYIANGFRVVRELP